MDLCLPQFDIYQSTVGSNCFESHTNSCCPDLFQKKCLSDVQSEIHLVRRNIVSTGFKNIYIQAWYGFFTHVFLIVNYWNFDIGMFVLRLSISVQVIKKVIWNKATCKSWNGELGNGMRGIRVGTRGIKVGMRGIRVGMRGIRMILRENLCVYSFG